MTKKQIKKYLAADGYICPYCGGDNITVNEREGNGIVLMYCTEQECGRQWKETWKLVNIEDA